MLIFIGLIIVITQQRSLSSYDVNSKGNPIGSADDRSFVEHLDPPVQVPNRTDFGNQNKTEDKFVSNNDIVKKNKESVSFVNHSSPETSSLPEDVNYLKEELSTFFDDDYYSLINNRNNSFIKDVLFIQYTSSISDKSIEAEKNINDIISIHQNSGEVEDYTVLCNIAGCDVRIKYSSISEKNKIGFELFKLLRTTSEGYGTVLSDGTFIDYTIYNFQKRQ